MKKCHNCHTELPDHAKFCFNCGVPQKETSFAQGDYRVRMDQDVQQQLVEQFFKAFKVRIETEHDPTQFSAYSERLYESGFRETIDRRTLSVASQLQERYQLGELNPTFANRWITSVFDNLLDYFLTLHCEDLNAVPIPEAILKYQGLSKDQADLFQMTLDYLDFANEEETVYTDFLVMPIEKLRTASKSFLFPEKNEKIWLICDQSLLGSCKEGFAFTENALYWKAHLQPARKVTYTNLQQIERVQDWLTINTFFYNTNKSLNFKTLKLLKKLKELHTSRP